MSVRWSIKPAAPERLLGAHVAHRAQHVARLRQAVVLAAAGQAEVGDPQFALVVESRFDGFTSRWTMPYSWAACSASAA